MSVIARCAATPRICELANDVAASTTVAAPAAIASFGSRSQFCWPTTSSIRYFDVRGSTSPASRLTTMITIPSASRWRCVQTRARASSQAPAEIDAFFLVLSRLAGALGREPSMTFGAAGGGTE